MAVSRIKTWNQGEVLTASDLNTELDNLNQTASAFPLTENVSAAGFAVTNAVLGTLKQLNENVYCIDNYATFAAAISGIGSAVSTLLINKNVNVTASATVPSTLTLWFVGAGKLTVSVACTATINGPIRAEPRQIFDGSGTVSFASNTYINSVQAAWWGAVGNDSTDSASAITASGTALGADGGVVELGTGVYQAGSTITLPVGVALKGTGRIGHVAVAGSTIIKATHSSGAVIKVTGSNVTLQDLVVSSDSTRYSGAAGSNYGIHVEAADSSGAETKRLHMERVRVTNQPNHGIVLVNDIACSQLNLVDVDNVDGHGIFVAGGTFTSRTNLTRPGQIQLNNCRVTRCGGHGLLIGGLSEDTTNDIPYRVEVRNYESFFNATDAAVRLSLHDTYISGENHQFDASAFDGRSDASTDAHTCFYMRGKNISLRNSRAINGNPAAGEIGVHPTLGTSDIEIKYVNVINTLQSAGFYDPAFVVASGCSHVTITAGKLESICTTLATDTSTRYETYSDGIIRTTRKHKNRALATSGIASKEAVMAMNDDTAAYIEFSAACHGSIIINSSVPGSGGAAVATFRVGDASNACVIMSSGGPTVTGTTGELAGTTGTDTHFTISASQTYNRLYVENRTGGARNYNYTLFNLGDGITASEMVAV